MLYMIAALLACGLDQLTKLWTALALDWGERLDLLPGVLAVTRQANTGMALSMLEGKTWFLGAVSVAACLALTWVLLKTDLPRGEKMMLALVLGGAAGNAIDRLLLGYVVDMIWVPLFVFNVADAFIDVGAALFAVLYIRRTAREEREAKEKAHDENG